MYQSSIISTDFHPDTRAFFKNKKVAVTGGAGFIGSHLVEQLLELKAHPVVITRRQQPAFLSTILEKVELKRVDLFDYAATLTAFKGMDIVISLAATVAGLAYNKKHPATIYHQNTQLFLNTIEAVKNADVSHFSTCSSACVYPRFCTLPTPEAEGTKDEPEPTNSGYGWAKRMQEYLSIKYAEEFGMKVAIPRPYNGYGPRDNFDTETSHVIPALIKKAFETQSDHFEVWGNGEHSRSFLYVDDFARGILEVTARYARSDPINIGADEEITIKELAHIVAKEVSIVRQREIFPKFNEQGLTGQPRRKCDVTKISRELQYQTHVQLETGLRKTVAWYFQHEINKTF
ncbi:MAG: hypothetical protein A3C44_03275 [Gammaproteobacteria bacterium RIFCSPHIGHO2_02_FULL_39_13]|nr:MAG: hypothetical protein A3C44_03275 [Gammaproteobacteria bacterium RIFCSPHIGHO2_02_FULL_39_13]OGT48552.1 MAG: hypothetical protein A3E53_04165 [Gammaproteobacteria bacterium RIFCSPHIGHO2_12_FULL_39_24]